MPGLISLDSDDEDAVIISSSGNQEPAPAAQPPKRKPPPKRTRRPQKAIVSKAPAPEVPLCIDSDEDDQVDVVVSSKPPVEAPLKAVLPTSLPCAATKNGASAEPDKRTPAAAKRVASAVDRLEDAAAKSWASALKGKSAAAAETTDSTEQSTPAELGSNGAGASARSLSAPGVDAAAAESLSADDVAAEALAEEAMELLQLETQAQALAEKALENVPAAARAEKVLKAKEGILKRLKEKAAQQRAVEESSRRAEVEAEKQRQAAERLRLEAERQRQAAADQMRVAGERLRQAATLGVRALPKGHGKLLASQAKSGFVKAPFQASPKCAVPKGHAKAAMATATPKARGIGGGNFHLSSFIKKSLVGRMGVSKAGESVDEEEAAEEARQMERKKRKALWGRKEGGELPDLADGKLTANGWEKSHFDSDEKKGKFLRLMGGQKLVDAAEAAADDDFPTDLPTFELTGGDWVEEIADDVVDEAANGPDRKDELQKLYSQARKQRLRPGQGLGAA